MTRNPNNIRVELLLTHAQHDALQSAMHEAGVKDRSRFILQALITQHPSIPDDMRGRGQYDRPQPMD